MTPTTRLIAELADKVTETRRARIGDAETIGRLMGDRDRLIEQNHTLQRQLEEAQIAVRSWRDAALNGEAKARQVFETWRQSRPFQHGENRSVLGEWFSHGTGQAFLDALSRAFQGSAEPPTPRAALETSRPPEPAPAAP